MFDHLPVSFILISCISIVLFGAFSFWLLNRSHTESKEPLVSIAERPLYEGPPHPCSVYYSFHEGKGCLVSRSLITGKDYVFPPHYRTFNVAELFLAYGYAFAEESFDSKIKLITV